MMTTQDIILKLFSPITKEQLKKAKGYCVRHGIDWALVLSDMTEEQRKAVVDAESQ